MLDVLFLEDRVLAVDIKYILTRLVCKDNLVLALLFYVTLVTEF